MLITRTPLRISIGGGGTDLPSFYEHHGGFVISAAIQKHVYIAVNETFTDDYLIKYSQMERVRAIPEIQHNIVRTALELHDVGPGIEIDSIADIPAGTGLGSSGAFTVGLLKALHALKRDHISDERLAEEACRLEIELLRQPVGKQDQYIAVYGGITAFEFHVDGSVTSGSLQLTTDTLFDLTEHLLMFFTGYSRQATSVLADQQKRSENGDREMLANLQFIKETGYEIKRCLESGDTDQFALLMNDHWQRKRARSTGMSNDQINGWYDAGIAAGALGGKLVGAGAGGFLLFFTRDPTRLRRKMHAEGLREVRFGFDLDGTTVLARD
jgi:D-glycero-alpha-D-manno-heptose-7-phosphate kinase